MFDRPRRPPEKTHETAPSETSEFDSLDKKTQKQLIRRSRRFGKTTIALTASAFTVTTPVHLYWTDVHANEELAATSLPQIKEILPEAEGIYTIPDSATYTFAGFDTRNGDVPASKLGSAVQSVFGGSVQSMDYGNAPLDAKELARQIIDHASGNGIRSINLLGNSVGGIIETETADEITAHSDLGINIIVKNQTPDGTEGLKPTTKNDLYTMLDFLKIEGAKYSTGARFVGTMTIESDRFLPDGDFNLEKFIETSFDTLEQVQEKRRPGMWLLVDQALAITDANIEEALRNIGSHRGDKLMPTIIYLRPADPDDDTVVKVVESSENICAYAKTADLNCSILHVENSPHTSYQFNTEGVRESLITAAPELIEMVSAERTEHAVNTYAEYMGEEMTTSSPR